MPGKAREHFCTLFDSKFLPYGVTLWRSLEVHAGPYTLWVLCMDEQVEKDLRGLALANLEIIPLREIETPELLAVKPGRSAGEYCWTLTPFIFPAVFARDPGARRVTYIDADLYFFDDPGILLAELDATGKTVLISDHGYDPRYDQSARCGRFCVQFNTFGRDKASQEINRRWREQCLEWCFDRIEDGKFGDQKYLDAWPEAWPDAVHILGRMDRTLAPWNVRRWSSASPDGLRPVFFHFHGFRPVAPDKAMLYTGYKIGAAGERLYETYLAEFSRTWEDLRSSGIERHTFRIRRFNFEPLREFLRVRVRGDRRYGALASRPG